MRDFRSLALRSLAVTLVVTACERTRSTTPSDTVPAVDSTIPVPAAPVREPLGWNDDAGPLLVVAAQAPGNATLVLPQFTDSTLTDTARFDVAHLRGTKVDLFSRAGRVAAGVPVQPAPAGEGADGERQDGCTAWPSARLTSTDDPLAWTVGLAAGRAQPIALDSIEGMSGADSARFAADITRLASTFPDGADSTFRGLPFVVRVAFRFTVAPGTEAVVADVMRRVNQEANPRVEHLLLVAERGADGRLLAAYSERTAGPEEDAEVTDVLAALAVGTPPRTTLVLARDYGDGLEYALLERTGARGWRVRWSSAYAGC